MNRKFFVALTFLLLVSLNGFGQTNSSVKNDISKSNSKQNQIKHIDSVYGYSVMIPSWWNIKEAPSPNFFGGTFPEIDKSKSALLFKAFEKEKFKSLENFENWVISGYKSGGTPKWSEAHKVLFKKNLEEFSNIGKAFKVQLKVEDTFYNCCYIIVETSKAFVWIDLTATRETYDINFKKLEDIMKEFKVL